MSIYITFKKYSDQKQFNIADDQIDQQIDPDETSIALEYIPCRNKISTLISVVVDMLYDEKY